MDVIKFSYHNMKGCVSVCRNIKGYVSLCFLGWSDRISSTYRICQALELSVQDMSSSRTKYMRSSRQYVSGPVASTEYALWTLVSPPHSSIIKLVSDQKSQLRNGHTMPPKTRRRFPAEGSNIYRVQNKIIRVHKNKDVSTNCIYEKTGRLKFKEH